ncbi:MAG: hypothetical protein ACE14S_08780 [Candidatus Bathyarchaeia archaeon]
MKKAAWTIFLAAVTLEMVVFGGGRFSGVLASSSVSGIISVDTTWTKANSPYTLTGNMLIGRNAVLTIEPGVTVNLANFYIKVNGTLAARGNAIEPVQFNGGSIQFEFSQDWDEQTGKGCIIENVFLNSTKVSGGDAVKISRSTLTAGISGIGYRSIVSNNIIKGGANGGTIIGNTIEGDVSGFNVSDNTITGTVNGRFVSNNTIRGGVNAGTTCNVFNNIIIGGISSGDAGDGVLMSSAYAGGLGFPVIENNTISNCKTGVRISILIRAWFGAAIPVVQNNLIINNSVGITYSLALQESYGYWQPTVIRNNTIFQNGVGFKGGGEHLLMEYNNILNNTEYNWFAGNTNATYNWWGTTDAQAIDRTIYDYKNDFELGRVFFIPFLAEPNAQAPAFSSNSYNVASSAQTPTPTPPTATPTQTSPTPTFSDSQTPAPSQMLTPMPTESQTPTTSLSPSPTSLPEESPTTATYSSQQTTQTPLQASTMPQTGLDTMEILLLAGVVVIIALLIALIGLVLKKRH